MGLMDKIFGTHSQHELKRIYPIVDRIEALEPEMKALSDAELKDKTREFKERLKEGETLDDILPEAYAVVREGASFIVVSFCVSLLFPHAVVPRSIQVHISNTSSFFLFFIIFFLS